MKEDSVPRSFMLCELCGTALKQISRIMTCTNCNGDRVKKILDEKFGMNKTIISTEETRMGGRETK